jgi:hypothetical protein
MAGDHLWLATTALASAIDSNPVHAEEVLSRMERELNVFPKDKRDEMRRFMTSIVAQLARLEVRMMETDGPVSR